MMIRPPGAHKKFKNLFFQIDIVRGVAEHNIIAVRAGVSFNMIRDFRHKGVFNAGYDEPTKAWFAS
jgi:hypothetical protein